MTATIQNGPAIVAGYLWTLRLIADDDVFPEGVQITGLVRRRTSDEAIMLTMSTANGRIARIDNRQVDLIIDGDLTKEWAAGTVVMDFVRTDAEPDDYLGFVLTVPVVLAVTRGLA